jgi:D-aminopeptidase
VSEVHNGLDIPWHARIREGARLGVEKAPKLQPVAVASPAGLEVDVLSPPTAEKLTLLPGVERTGGLTVQYVSVDFETVWNVLWAMVFTALTTCDPIPWF